MSAPAVAIVPAAGSGTRFCSDVPKQYLLLHGRMVIVHTIERLLQETGISSVIVALAKDHLEDLEGMVPGDRVTVVEGGNTRQESVRLAVAAAPREAELVAVHDAVRPFFRRSTLRELLRLAAATGASIPGLPVVESVHAVRDGMISGSLDRSALVSAQTPQCFRLSLLRSLLERAASEGVDRTDEAGLAVFFGVPVVVVPGDPRNIKITRQQDLELAETNFHAWSGE